MMMGEVEWVEVVRGERWTAEFRSLELRVAYDPDHDQFRWAVAPHDSLPMARGGRWGPIGAREDAEKAAREILGTGNVK